MGDEKELDKLYEYGGRLLDSIEKDYQSELQKAKALEAQLEKKTDDLKEILSSLENVLEKAKG